MGGGDTFLELEGGGDDTLPPEVSAHDATVIEGSSPSLPPLERQLVDEALRSGLITRAQADRLIESLIEASVDGPEATMTFMVARGLITESAAEDLWGRLQQDFVPGYVLRGELGRGAMGVVYRAEQTRLKRVVALKVVNPKLTGDPSYVRRFKREALALAKLNHPNIVQVYDYGEAEGMVYLALELVSGTDCGELIKKQGRLAERTALVIVRDAALGLSHAHQAGIVHRDVKPGNLLVVEGAQDARGEGLIAKVTDLGLARETQQGSGEATQAGTILGTPAYMAPEQTEGKPADYRADIYALGATLYHAVTGQLPYQDSSVLNMLIKKRTEPLDDPRRHAPGLSDATVRLLDRMLARDLAERYDDYAALLEDLERVLAGQPIVRDPVPRAASSLDLAPDDPVTRKLSARELKASLASEPARRESGRLGAAPPPAPGGLLPRLLGVAAVGLVAAALGWAALFAGASGEGGAGGTGGASGTGDTGKVEPVPDRPPVSPAAAAEKTVAALEGLPPADLLAQPQTLAGLREQLAALPAADRPALELRLVALTRRALQATEEATLARLEELYAAGEYARLAAGAERALAPYVTFELEPPSRLSELAELARAAAQDGAGEREREAWRAIEAAAGKPVRVVELGERFAERFPFSPVAAEVARRVAEAEQEAPRVSLQFEPIGAAWSLEGSEPEITGPFAGRLRRGVYELRASAEGYLPLALRLTVDGPLERTLALGPRPERALVPDPDRGAPLWNPRRFVEDWARIGTWEAVLAVSGMTGEAGPSPASAQRSLVALRRYLKGVPGWTFDWELVRPDGAPGVEGLTAEGRLFSEPALAIVVGVAEGRVYFGLRRPDPSGSSALERLADAPAPGHPLHLHLDWDGTLVVARAGDLVLGSFAPGWREPPATFELATLAGRAQFRDIKLSALKPAD